MKKQQKNTQGFFGVNAHSLRGIPIDDIPNNNETLLYSSSAKKHVYDNAGGSLTGFVQSDSIPSIANRVPVYVGNSGTLIEQTSVLITSSNAISCATLNTGQGPNELYPMDQAVRTTDAVTFASVNTGHGNNEVYPMDQAVRTTDAVTFASVNTGHGNNELYAMNQAVRTTDSPTFVKISAAIANLYSGCIFGSTFASIPDATWTKVTLNQSSGVGKNNVSILNNNSSVVDTANSKLIIQRAGNYLIVGTVTFFSNATGSREVNIYINGTSTFGPGVGQAASTVNTRNTVQVTQIIELAASDELELYAWQNSGGALNTGSNGNYRDRNRLVASYLHE